MAITPSPGATSTGVRPCRCSAAATSSAIFAPGASGHLRTTARVATATTSSSTRPTTSAPSAMGADGELYFADYGNGRIRRLARSGGGGADTIPSSLADTGCVDAIRSRPAPASGLIPYAVNAPFWSDGAGEGTLPRDCPMATQIGSDGGGGLRLPGGLGDPQVVPPGRPADRDAAAHATSGRRVGRLHLRVERGADGRHARDRRQDAPGRAGRRGSIPARASACSATRRRRASRSGRRSPS